ncbi:LysM peptidoglycan-binding domain-containing protein [bacterium]|nr:LysM peptidoglycan-binding domain-containing protein [bacterium]
MKRFIILFISLVVFLPVWTLAVTETSAGNFTIVIKKGDTIHKIAKQYLKNPKEWQKIVKFEENKHIKNPNKIYPGQAITIPFHLLKEEYVQKPIAIKSEEVEKLKAEIKSLKAEVEPLRVEIKEKNDYIAKLKEELTEKCAYLEEQNLKITNFQDEVSTLTMSLNNKELSLKEKELLLGNKETLLKEKEEELKVAKAEAGQLSERLVKMEEEYKFAQKAVKADEMVAKSIISLERAKEKGALRYEKQLVKSAELLKEKAAWAMIRKEYERSVVLAEESIKDASEAEQIADNMAGKYKISFLFDHFYFWNLKNKPTLLKTE